MRINQSIFTTSVACFMIAVSFFSTTAYAASEKIAVVDFQQIVEKSNNVTAVNKKIENQFKPRQEKILKESQALQKKMDSLRRNQTVMTSDQVAQLQDEIVAQRASLQAKEQAFEEELKLAQSRAYRKFMTQVDAAIEKVATQKGYDIVVRKQTLPYVNQRLDITSQVIAAMSKD